MDVRTFTKRYIAPESAIEVVDTKGVILYRGDDAGLLEDRKIATRRVVFTGPEVRITVWSD